MCTSLKRQWMVSLDIFLLLLYFHLDIYIYIPCRSNSKLLIYLLRKKLGYFSAVWYCCTQQTGNYQTTYLSRPKRKILMVALYSLLTKTRPALGWFTLYLTSSSSTVYFVYQGNSMICAAFMRVYRRLPVKQVGALVYQSEYTGYVIFTMKKRYYLNIHMYFSKAQQRII